MAWIKPFEDSYLIKRKSDGLYMGRHKHNGWVSKPNLALTTTKENVAKMYKDGHLSTHFGVSKLSELEFIKSNGVLI